MMAYDAISKLCQDSIMKHGLGIKGGHQPPIFWFQYARVVKIVGSNPAAIHWMLGLKATGMLRSAYELRAN